MAYEELLSKWRASCTADTPWARIPRLADLSTPPKNPEAKLLVAIERYCFGETYTHETRPDPPADLAPHTALETFTIPASDPRIGLRGQQGVRVRGGCDIKMGEVLAVYRSFVEDADSEEWLSFLRGLEPSGSRVVTQPGWTPPPGADVDARHIGMYRYYERKLQIEAFTLDFEYWGNQREAYLAALGKECSIDHLPSLVVSAFGYGNIGALCNSAGWGPAAKGKAKLPSANADFVEVHIQGRPFTFILAKANIKAGQEVLLEYGPAYWNATNKMDDLSQLRKHRIKSCAEGKLSLSKMMPLSGASSEPASQAGVEEAGLLSMTLVPGGASLQSLFGKDEDYPTPLPVHLRDALLAASAAIKARLAASAADPDGSEAEGLVLASHKALERLQAARTGLAVHSQS